MLVKPRRSATACEICQRRKVRCVVITLGQPCTNCTAFQLECRMPKRKQRKPSARAIQLKENASRKPTASNAVADSVYTLRHGEIAETVAESIRSGNAKSSSEQTLEQNKATALHGRHYEDNTRKGLPWTKPLSTPDPSGIAINSPRQRHYIDSTPHIDSKLQDKIMKGISMWQTSVPQWLDSREISILQKRGALLLPSKQICDDLVKSYFEWVYPIMPTVNRTEFIEKYNDPENPPSLLLLQAIFSASSRMCSSPELRDADGSTDRVAATFYKRAKALYDANYEKDQMAIVQSLLLMGRYCQGPDSMTENVLYWCRLAITVAQGLGMHSENDESTFSPSEKRLRKRVWWTLFAYDRSVSAAFGRPLSISDDDVDVEMVTEDDFVEEAVKHASTSSQDGSIRFFIHYVRLSQLLGRILVQHYLTRKSHNSNAATLTHDRDLAEWLCKCPAELYWKEQQHGFWPALLHAQYYTTLALLHRAQFARSYEHRNLDSLPPHSKEVAAQAADKITLIVDQLRIHDQLQYCPQCLVYSVFSAVGIHVGQAESITPSLQPLIRSRIHTCMKSLREIAKVWHVGGMAYTLFQSILGHAGQKHRQKPTASGLQSKTSDWPGSPQQAVSLESASTVSRPVTCNTPAQRRVAALAHPEASRRVITPTTATDLGIFPSGAQDLAKDLGAFRSGKDGSASSRSDTLQSEGSNSGIMSANLFDWSVLDSGLLDTGMLDTTNLHSSVLECSSSESVAFDSGIFDTNTYDSGVLTSSALDSVGMNSFNYGDDLFGPSNSTNAKNDSKIYHPTAPYE